MEKSNPCFEHRKRSHFFTHSADYIDPLRSVRLFWDIKIVYRYRFILHLKQILNIQKSFLFHCPEKMPNYSLYLWLILSVL